MNYYIANLGVHVVLITAMIAVICIFADKVRRRKAKNIVFYFLPVAVTILVIVYAVAIVVPRMFDLRNVVNKNYSTAQGTVEKVSLLKNYITVDGVAYYRNPTKECPEKGDEITFKYSDGSKFMPEWKIKE